MVAFWNRYGPEILQHSGEHLWLVMISTGIAALIGIPTGVLIAHNTGLSRPILGFANIVQTIPSLALFGFLIPLPILGGLGTTPAVFALILYALLPIIRSTYTSILNINPAIKEAAIGMGMTGRQLLLQVEIPLASSGILSGVRVAAVISVGTATIAAYIGAGGLGNFIFRGVTILDNQLILAGAIPAAFLALLIDFSLGWLERTTKRIPG